MKLSAFAAIAAVIGGSFLIPVPAEAFWWGNKDAERRTQAVPLKPQTLVNDYESNEPRFRKNWVGPLGEQKFVSASGYVRGEIEGWGSVFRVPNKVKLKNGKSADLLIQCSNTNAKGKDVRKFADDISMLNDGDFVRTTFNVQYNDYAEKMEQRNFT